MHRAGPVLQPGRAGTGTGTGAGRCLCPGTTAVPSPPALVPGQGPGGLAGTPRGEQEPPGSTGAGTGGSGLFSYHVFHPRRLRTRGANRVAAVPEHLPAPGERDCPAPGSRDRPRPARGRRPPARRGRCETGQRGPRRAPGAAAGARGRGEARLPPAASGAARDPARAPSPAAPEPRGAGRGGGLCASGGPALAAGGGGGCRPPGSQGRNPEGTLHPSPIADPRPSQPAAGLHPRAPEWVQQRL